MANEFLNVGTFGRAAAIPVGDSPLDLRAPAAVQLRRGVAFDWVRALGWLLIDALALGIAWWLATDDAPALRPSGVAGVVLPLGLLVGAGFYGREEQRSAPFAPLWAVALVYGLLAAFPFREGLEGGILVRAALAAALLLPFLRFLARGIVAALRRRGYARSPVFVVGEPEDRTHLLAVLARQSRYVVVGEAPAASAADEHERLALIARLRRTGVQEVFICSWQAVPDPLLLYWQFKSAGIRLCVLPGTLELPRHNVALAMLEGMPALKFAPSSIVGIDFRIKRLFDLTAASAILLAIAPLIALIAVLIRLDSPGPVFFLQTRIGLGGRCFKVWKFRTMVSDAERLQGELEEHNEMGDGVMFKMKNDPRITRVGRVLRRWSLDELPQIFNVLAGEMSLVGPRPFPLRDVERFRGEHFIRQRVLPGITGLWQVSGRSEITDFEEVIRLDTYYIQHWSLALDLEILLRTFSAVLRREGAY